MSFDGRQPRLLGDCIVERMPVSVDPNLLQNGDFLGLDYLIPQACELCFEIVPFLPVPARVFYVGSDAFPLRLEVS